ncbi:MAG TPA: 30S ribosomal protein S9 [Desulfosalsimonadaceae bacterium]|nr:30S ribosomal protein S9 [Desulfosalsimonadaceae bacterium]
MEKENVFYATGKRKTAVARTWLKPGNGEIVINNKPLEEYFPLAAAQRISRQALELTNTTGNYDIKVNVKGGGTLGQAEAVRHGITRTLFLMNPEFRQILKKAGFVKRDPREKERKKYGQRGARARFQFSKR